MGALDMMMAAVSGEEKLYVDDVFSTYLYTGNGATQTINNGIDLAGKGGLVWIKERGGTSPHLLFDTVRGAGNPLTSSDTTAQNTGGYAGYQNFLSNGFSLGNIGNLNGTTSQTYTSWTFRRAPKFFDVVTYTGNGVAGRQIAHSLGVAPGMIITKTLSGIGNWCVQHNGLSFNNNIFLNSANAQTGIADIASVFNANYFVVNVGSSNSNANGVQYVAYLFAHDPSAEGIIQCGSFTTDASGNATVNLGWEPQWLLTKTSSTVDSWQIDDTMRSWSQTTYGLLFPNLSNPESNGTTSANSTPTATGFSARGRLANTTYIYLAIRRPNKPPKTGTEVYNAVARTGVTGQATITGVGFVPDFVGIKNRTDSTGDSGGYRFIPRLTNRTSDSSTTSSDTGGITTLTQDGASFSTYSTSVNHGAYTYINHFFRRAPGFMDVVCYTGTGEMSGNVQHSFGGKPELTICKARNAPGDWWVSYGVSGTRWSLKLNDPSWLYANQVFEADADYFPVRQNGPFAYNASGVNYVAYLFASLPGISKVGIYTGNGSSQTINCGFAMGARFVLIKRTDASGDWYVWDTERGIVAANDPHLSLNSTAAEVTTDDSVDPDASGFIVNQNSATNINVSGGQYIFLAIA